MARFFKANLLLAVLAAAVLAFAGPKPAEAAAPTKLPGLLLSLDGIQGGFATEPYKGAIVLTDYTVGTSAASPKKGTETGVKVQDQEIRIRKTMDASSLPLLKALSTGQSIKSGVLRVQDSNPKGNATYMEVRMTGIRVTAFDTVVKDGTTAETIRLQVKEATVAYTPPPSEESPGGGGSGSGPGPGTGPGEEHGIITQYHVDPIKAAAPKGQTYIQGFRVSLKATATGSTVQSTQYRINGGEWKPYLGPFDVYASDTRTVEYYSANQAGDREKVNVMDFDKGTFTGNGSY
ncbi:type VI secretion system tube protein Hcp [Cohnella sp. REN36]|uniref:type VI secretion system tube protein Hcp n=1 Tax=Cohnella sp. REN36 TaxID=2887347 RepID=UPI001D140FDE|nr:type VI secretion system tube protein Hcp [Cohnella sp. REN36]MCC3372637.1 type VI secretion system tube protein Hcp [Cohnella sp. REN36]